MGDDGEVLATELRQPGDLHVQLLPTRQGVHALIELGAVQAVVDQTVAPHTMHHEALQRHFGHGAQHQRDVWHHN